MEFVRTLAQDLHELLPLLVDIWLVELIGWGFSKITFIKKIKKAAAMPFKSDLFFFFFEPF